MRFRRPRFRGAGGSADRKFNELTRQNIRDEWRTWTGASACIIALTVWSFYAHGAGARFLAWSAGALFGTLFVLYSLGGHMSAFRWWLGAEGERSTASEIEKLGSDWHCEHDIEHGHGNWDHVLVGPPGIFLIDSKLLHGTSAAGGDALRAGRLDFSGRRLRGGARSVYKALEERLGQRPPWVQAMFVVWGDFPQKRHEEQKVVYLAGEELKTWLEEQPAVVNGPQRAALIEALKEVRASAEA